MAFFSATVALGQGNPAYYAGSLMQIYPTTGIYLDTSRTLRLGSDNGTNYVELGAPTGMSSNWSLTMPSTAGSSGLPLVTDGSGNASWSLGNQSSALTSGYLSSTDWNTFNNKQSSLTFGSISTTTTGVTIGSGNNSTVGPNVTVNIQTASTSQPGILAAADWNTFNNKQPSGNYITALTGNVVANGPGSVSATIQANVVSNSMLSQMATNTIKGNNTGSTANAADLTTAQVAAILPAFIGDSGAGGTQGLVPAPPTASRQYADYLSASGSWAYVDQAQPIYPAFSFVNQTASPLTATKYENVAVYTGIDGYKQYAAIVAGGGTGTLFIYDVTDPNIPVYINKIVLSGAYNLSIATISGSVYAFIPSSGGSTLYIENITNPYSISTYSSLALSGSPGALYSCQYANGYVYVATQNKGLTVVDVGGGLAGGTLAVPIQSFQEGGTTNKTAGVAVSGNYVYTTNYQTSFPATVRYFKTWELAAGGGTLAVPFLANTFTVAGGPTGTSSKPQGVSISSSGTTAFVTDGNQSVYDIIDITTPTSPVYLTYVTPTFPTVPNNTLGVAIQSGNYLYISSGANATYGGAIDFFDITNRSSPVKISTVYNNDPSSPFGGIALANGYIYVADYGSAAGLSYLDIFTQPQMSVPFGNQVGSTLSVKGLTEGITPVTASYTALTTDTTIMANASAAAYTVTLPTAVGIAGKIYNIKKTDSSANAVTVGTTSSQNIEGSTTYSLSVQYKYVDVISDGTQWWVIGNN